MKAKLTKGKGFRGLLDYLYGAGEKDVPGRAHAIGGSVPMGTPRELAAQFKITREKRPGIKKPVFHSSLSLPAGEHLSDDEWLAVASDYLIELDFDIDKTQWHVVRHSDTDHDHVHIVASKITLDGGLWKDSNDVKRAIEATQRLEKKHGLTITQGMKPDHEMEEDVAVKTGEIKEFERTGELSNRLLIQQRLQLAEEAAGGDFPAFIEALRDQRVELLPSGASGRVGGASFALENGDAIKGSAVGSKWSWGKLAKRVGFDENDAEHVALIARLRERAAQRKSKSALEFHAPAPEERKPAPPRRRNRTLDLAFTYDNEARCWRWKNHPELDPPPIVDGGSKILCNSRRDSAVRACIQACHERWGDGFTVFGSEEFRRAAWIEAQKLGIELKGYEPTEEEIESYGISGGFEKRVSAADEASGGQAARSDRAHEARAVADDRASRADDRAARSGAGRAVELDGSDTERSREAADQADEALEQRGGAQDHDARSEDQAARERVASARNSASLGPQLDTSDGASNASSSVENSDHHSDVLSDSDGSTAYARILELAAAHVKPRDEPRPVSLQTSDLSGLSKSMYAKVAGWRRQAAALGAEKYRLTIVDRRSGKKPWNLGKGQGEDGGERFFTAEEVEKKIGLLSRKNAQGCDIYVTPIADDRHYILLDDSNEECIERLKSEFKMQPALVQESSPGNLQAVIIAEKKYRQDEQSIGNAFLISLNRKLGDPAITGVVHPFRMAGFSNAKPKHEDENKRRPFTNLVEARGDGSHDAAASSLLERFRVAYDEKNSSAEKVTISDKERAVVEREIEELRGGEFRGSASVKDRFRALWQAHARLAENLVGRGVWHGKTSGEPDWSRVDFYAVKQLLAAGVHQAHVVKALADGSPGLAHRHHDPMKYAQTTVENALLDAKIYKQYQSARADNEEPERRARHRQDEAPTL